MSQELDSVLKSSKKTISSGLGDQTKYEDTLKIGINAWVRAPQAGAELSDAQSCI
jgi:hypothetical protein